MAFVSNLDLSEQSRLLANTLSQKLADDPTKYDVLVDLGSPFLSVANHEDIRSYFSML